MIKKIVVFYHGNCRDGLGGEWAAWKKFGNRAEYIPLVWEESLKLDPKNKTVYFIDFVPDMKTILKLKRTNKVIAIDHHISSEKMTKVTDEYLYAVNHSGSVLAWKYFHPKKTIPRILKYIEDTDIWNWKLPKSREISARMDLSGNGSMKIFDALARKFENKVFFNKYAKEGKILLDAEKKEIDQIIRLTETPVKFAGHKILAVNSPVHRSIIGHMLANKTGTFSIVWVERSNVIKVSLRSVKDFDVAKIAHRYGGGGHKNAASFSIEKGKKPPWKILK